MVSHSQLQFYSHNYGAVCMTGLLGCRWHRYKQSTKGSKKRDVIGFLVLLAAFLFITFWFYFTLLSENNKHNLNWYMYNRTDQWIPVYTIFLAFICVLFSYLIILMFLSLCHIVQGHQLFIHPSHLVGLVLVVAICVTLTIVVQELWEARWALIYISLQVFGPFLQLGAVVLMTFLTWVIAAGWFRITHCVWKSVSMIVYLLVMVGLYTSPLFIKSPCVILQSELPTKPKLFAHRGASAIAPDNTVISFEKASKYSNVAGFETDVHMSYDGVPFLMHSGDLRQTTNVDDVFPDLAHNPPSSFNMTQLQMLSTGKWFLEIDPYGMVGDLTDSERTKYGNQSIQTFLQFLLFASDVKKDVIFDINEPPKDHPYFNDTKRIVVDVISMSGIKNRSQVYWVNETQPDFTPSYYKIVSPLPANVQYLKENNISAVNLEDSAVDMEQIRRYRENNITTMVYMVNTVWLYSFYWCLGVDVVHTDFCNSLSQIEKPVWLLSPQDYLALWVIVDVVSFIAVFVIFLCQRSRLLSNKYNPEQAALNSVHSNVSTWSNKRTRRSMKEKLLMKDVQADTFDFEPEDDLGIESNGYDITVTASEGRILSQAFHNNRASYSSNQNDNNRDSYHGNYGDSFNDITIEHCDSFFGTGNSENGSVRSSNRNSYHSNNNQTEAEIA